MDTPDGSYQHWLVHKVVRMEGPPTPSTSYRKLMMALYHKEFVWLLSGDDNRVADGLELRQYYANETGVEYKKEWDAIGCSVLEMLIALSARTEFASYTSAYDWFWIFLDNLGLKDQNDATFEKTYVESVLYNFIWRMYDYAGNGGLFPLREPPEDQRNVEIWYQFSYYWAENSKYQRL